MESGSCSVSRQSQLLLTFILILGAGLLITACDAPEKPYVVDMASTNSFLPAAITVPRGSKVIWKNRDHEVHSTILQQSLPAAGSQTADPSGAAAWDSGELVTGATFVKTFVEPGTYLYICRYHDEMVGTIIVTDSPDLDQLQGD